MPESEFPVWAVLVLAAFAITVFLVRRYHTVKTEGHYWIRNRYVGCSPGDIVPNPKVYFDNNPAKFQMNIECAAGVTTIDCCLAPLKKCLVTTDVCKSIIDKYFSGIIGTRLSQYTTTDVENICSVAKKIAGDLGFAFQYSYQTDEKEQLAPRLWQ